MARTLLLLVLLLVAGARELAAQHPAALLPGARVRISAPTVQGTMIVPSTARWMVGTVREVDAQGVVLQTEGSGEESTFAIPFDVMRDIQVSRGQRSSGEAARHGATRGAQVGAGIALGAAAFLKLGELGGIDCGERCDLRQFRPTKETLARNVLIGGASGALIGALLRGQSREHWEAIPRPRVGVGADARGATLLFSFAR